MLAVTSITFLAFVGLGTETGAWYLAKRNGQNAADATATSSAVNIYGSASATAQSICTTGGCNGCGSATFKTPAQSSQENWRL